MDSFLTLLYCASRTARVLAEGTRPHRREQELQSEAKKPRQHHGQLTSGNTGSVSYQLPSSEHYRDGILPKLFFGGSSRNGFFFFCLG